MAELVNLRAARKRAKRRQQEGLADAERRAHGQPKRLRELAVARQTKAERDLDRHKIETGDDR
jgi:hypothetical protein